MAITLYHNPRCSKSRAALALLGERGAKVDVVEYLKNAPDERALRELAGRIDGGIRAMVRGKESLYRELGLADADDETLLRALASHPILLERPIAVSGKRAIVGRPPERVLELT